MTADGKLIRQSTHANKLFDDWTGHAVYVMKTLGGKSSLHGFSKTMAPDGEFILWEFHGDSKSGITLKPLYGTGKWKGVKGEAKGKVTTGGKPIVTGTFQGCQKCVGWIELPK